MKSIVVLFAMMLSFSVFANGTDKLVCYNQELGLDLVSSSTKSNFHSYIIDGNRQELSPTEDRITPISKLILIPGAYALKCKAKVYNQIINVKIPVLEISQKASFLCYDQSACE